MDHSANSAKLVLRTVWIYTNTMTYEWTNNNSRKTAQLGIPHGTAYGRLRKEILFSVLKRHNENVCFRCRLPILGADDLSIDHRNPWLDVDPKLFWDIDNIAFSHLRCNISAARRVANDGMLRSNIELRKKGEDGTAWCSTHKDYLPVSKFGKNKNRWNGLSNTCNECRSKKRSPKKWRKRSDLNRTTSRL